MLMIIGHHYVLRNYSFNLQDQPFSLEQFSYLCIYSLGKIGVACFFMISAWYLCLEKDPQVRISLRRTWILEREVLFYSLGLLMVLFILNPSTISKKDVLKSFIPTASGLWWYVTAYVIFLFFCPFITKGLRCIGKNLHASLCLIMLIMWGIVYGLLPGALFGLSTEGFIDFIYIYIIIAFYRWYMDDWGLSKAWFLIGGGTAILLSSIALLQSFGTVLHIPSLRTHSTYLAASCVRLPVLLIALGLIILAHSAHWRSSIINAIASTTFGVYLIHDYPPVSKLLWDKWFKLSSIYDSPYALLYSLAIIFFVFSICMVIDFLRQCIFKITIDRHAGKWFVGLSTWISERRLINRLQTAVMKSPSSDKS